MATLHPTVERTETPAKFRNVVIWVVIEVIALTLFIVWALGIPH